MIRNIWIRWLSFLRRERRWFLAGGRDVYETTRRSFFSLEARAGAALFGGFFFLSLAQAPVPAHFFFDPGPAFVRLSADAAPETDLFLLTVFFLYLGVGALLGIFLRNAWDWAEEFLPVPPRRVWTRRFRWSTTTFLLLFLHGGFLLSALRAKPGFYAAAFHGRGGPLRWFQDWLASGFLSYPGRLWTLAAYAVMAAGMAQMGRRFRRWFLSFPMPTRVASGVLGVGTFFFLLGLWGVFRFHRPPNEGPNAVVLVVEGLRTEDLRDPERAPALNSLARRGRTFASCVPTVPQREASLMTLLTGRLPLSHGIRHAFPSGGDVGLGSDSLPVQLRRGGYETAALADAGGDLLCRLSPAFDRVRAPDLSVPGILKRDILRRAVHLLPYLRGLWARELIPPLRAIPEFNDPGLLAQEADAMLKQLRFESRFLLLVHFSAGRDRRTVDKAVGRILQALKNEGLDDSTWVVLWSPFAAPGEEEKDGGRDVSSPSRFSAPLVVAGPLRRSVPRWGRLPVRDVDVAPTILSALGVSVPEAMEGLPLLDVNPDSEGFADRRIYTETDVWMKPEDNPLPPAIRLEYGLPASWLEEDPEALGRLRIRPATEDAVLSYRHRLLQTGGERLVYRPSRSGVIFEYYDLTTDPAARINRAGTRAGAERVRELKEVLFQELRSEVGWRPQNDYWIPEAFMREKK